MKTSLGASVGSSMTHCALMTTSEDGVRTVETRLIDDDTTAGLSIGDRIGAGFDLLEKRAAEREQRIDGFGVACRTADEARAIRTRSRGARRDVVVVSEADAILQALGATGEIDRFAVVSIVDFGDSGLSIYKATAVDGDIANAEVGDFVRYDDISGQKIDAELADRVTARIGHSHIQSRADRILVATSCRIAKEDLSTAESATILTPDSHRNYRIDREEFEGAVATQLDLAVTHVDDYITEHTDVEAIVVVGGCANIPSLSRRLTKRVHAELVVPREPESLASVGAAMMALTHRKPDNMATIGGARQPTIFALGTPVVVVCAVAVVAAMALFAIHSINGTSSGGDEVTTSNVELAHSAETTASHVAPASSEAPARSTAPIPSTVDRVQPTSRRTFGGETVPTATERPTYRRSTTIDTNPFPVYTPPATTTVPPTSPSRSTAPSRSSTAPTTPSSSTPAESGSQTSRPESSTARPPVGAVPIPSPESTRPTTESSAPQLPPLTTIPPL